MSPRVNLRCERCLCPFWAEADPTDLVVASCPGCSSLVIETCDMPPLAWEQSPELRSEEPAEGEAA